MELDDGFYNFPCPHELCGLMISVHHRDINCAIFRHAVLKETMKQIDPHATREVCESLVLGNKVYGCAKPYEMYRVGESWLVRTCEYK
jgi:hypothetical protein